MHSCGVLTHIHAESGLQYLRARYYEPATGQFVSRDPMLTQTRDPDGYVARGPLNATDPSGELCQHIFGHELGWRDARQYMYHKIHEAEARLNKLQPTRTT